MAEPTKADVDFWDAVNAFADASKWSVSRQKAVVRIESLRKKLQEQHRRELADAEQAGYERGKRKAEASHTADVAAMLFEIERYIENASSTATLFASYRKAHGIVDDGVPPWTK